MSDTYTLHLNESMLSGEQPVAWTRSGHQPGSGYAPLSELSTLLGEHRPTIILAGTDILYTHCRVPSKKRQRILQAVPFLLEENLATDVDALHFAIGPVNDDGEITVCIAAREAMQRWLNVLREHHITPRRLVNEIDCLPTPENGEWHLLFSDHVVLRHSSVAGLSFDMENATLLLNRLLDSEPVPASVCVYVTPSVTENQLEPMLSVFAARNIPCQTEVDKTDSERLAQGAGKAINLLQQQYAVRTENRSSNRLWLWPSLATAAAILVVTISQYIHMSRLHEQSEHLYQETVSVFTETFPGRRMVGDGRQQMEQQLRQLQQGGNDALSELLVPLVKTVANQASTKVTRLSFRNDSVDLELQVDNIGNLESLTGQMEQAGLSARIVNADSADSKVFGRLAIKGADR